MSNSSSRLINLNQNNDSNTDSSTPLPTRDTLKDKLNQQIIDLLELDGRLPFKEIANTLDISEGTVRNRVNRMKDAGVLQIKALVDRSAINYSTDSMLGIKVASNSSPSSVAQRLESCNEIVFIMWVTGRYDLLVEIASESDDTLSKFLEEHCFNNDDIKERNLPNQTKGLVITNIENDSPLINSIELNSIIIEAQKKKIKSANELKQVVSQVLKTNQKTILLVIYNSQNQRRYIGIKLK